LKGAVYRSTRVFPTQVMFLDIHFEKTGNFQQNINIQDNAFVYVYRGALSVVNGSEVSEVPFSPNGHSSKLW
jgi:redox-sensitive bicupin YhaK (pirin superfamily)